MAQIYRFDTNGIPFEFPAYFLEPEEYAKILSEINTNYFKYKDKTIAVHYSDDNIFGSFKYYFENHGYNDYNIYSKQLIL